MNLEQDTAPTFSLAAFFSRARWQGATGIVALYLLLGGLTLSPLLTTAIPPLVDYPNHLARMFVLLHSGENASGTVNYVAHWRLLPNLAMDLVVPVLAHLVPLEAAGRLFIAVTMALLVIGTATLHRALYGRMGLWPLCALSFVYNAALWWGFINYVFSLGVALVAFSAWIATARWSTLLRLTVFAAVSSVLFILHLFAFGVYGLLVASYEAGNLLPRNRRTARGLFAGIAALSQFFPAGVLWLLMERGPEFTRYNGLGSRVFSLFAPTSFNFPPSTFDRTYLLLGLVFVAIAVYTRAITLASTMRLPLAVMIIGSLLMPEFVSGSWAAHIRLPIAFVFVAVASMRLTVSRRWPVALCASLALALLATRVWAVSQDWRDMNEQVIELRAALQTVPEGIRLLIVESDEVDQQPIAMVPPFVARRAVTEYWHLPTLAVIDRNAFVPSLFTGWYPIEPSARNIGMARIMFSSLSPQELAERAHTPPDSASLFERDPLGEPPCCLDWSEIYDFVLWIDLGKPPRTLLPELQPWTSGSFFHIYRIVHS